MSATVDHALVEAIAQRVCERVCELLEERDRERQAPGPRLVDAAELARTLGCRREFVYRHATMLGAIRLGENGRLRFDVEAAKAAMSCSVSKRSERENGRVEASSEPVRGRARRHQPNRLPPAGEILPLRVRS